jgi:hypothetical protein
MSARKQPEDNHKFQVGDRVSVTLQTGLIVEGTARAIEPAAQPTALVYRA